MRTTSRFHQWLTTSTGRRFRGAVSHVASSGMSSTSFVETRTTLHVLYDEPISPGELVFDASNRRFLVGTHDVRLGKRVHKLFELTTALRWQRPESEIDLVTQLEKSKKFIEMEPLWCVVEIYGRQEVDRAMHNAVERTRIITGGDIRLNDVVDGRLVRRIYEMFGVKVAEIQ